MSKEKISSQEVVELISSKASVSKRAAEEFLKVMISSIEEALQVGEAVKIKGFGTFKLQWVEPRKSVNVNTQEEILLDGYHKVTFTPDATLKDLVNEPFAHLSAISLDETDETVREKIEEEPILDPLRIFEEQASEIKSLISEINALSTKSKPKAAKPEVVSIVHAVPVERVEIKDYDLSDFIVDDETSPDVETVPELAEVVIVQDKAPVLIEDAPAPVVVEEAQSSELSVEEVYTANPFIADIKPRRKISAWVWILLLVFLLSGGGVASYFFYPPVTQFANTTIQNIHIADFVGNLKGMFTKSEVKVVTPKTVVVPKDTLETDSLNAAHPVDSLQILFDSPREYPITIGRERITAGSRLARMAERYYGKSDFWVYIYEANRLRLKHPDSISSGTLINIPKVDARLIDAKNPRCIQKAKELHDLYVSR